MEDGHVVLSCPKAYNEMGFRPGDRVLVEITGAGISAALVRKLESPENLRWIRENIPTMKLVSRAGIFANGSWVGVLERLLETSASLDPLAPQNRVLRLKEERLEEDGVERVWEILEDIPDLVVGGFSGGGRPVSPREGDELRETPGDGLTPFSLWRGGRKIASPESWQVAGLFEGLRDGGSRGASPSEVSRPIEALSDDGAIFELLAQIGCVPPSGGEE